MSGVFFSQGDSQPHHMCVLYDFIARNQRELTIRKGEIVEVSQSQTQKSLEQNFPSFFSAVTKSNKSSWLLCVRSQLLDTSKQWWKVRNSRGEEGFVPNNVLETHDPEADEVVPTHTQALKIQQKLR